MPFGPVIDNAVASHSTNEDIMATGTVKFFAQDKGFGFITPEGGAKDVFVHISALQASGIQTLKDGQQVSFDTEPDRMGKGPKAVNIQAF